MSVKSEPSLPYHQNQYHCFSHQQFAFLLTLHTSNGLHHSHLLLTETADFINAQDHCMVVTQWLVLCRFQILSVVSILYQGLAPWPYESGRVKRCLRTVTHSG